MHYLVTKFQSALPMRGATSISFESKHFAVISIRAPHAGSDAGMQARLSELEISIRAPHAGSDFGGVCVYVIITISIRAPHAGSDLHCCKKTRCCGIFQSALPMRGASESIVLENYTYLFQSALPMRGAT